MEPLGEQHWLRGAVLGDGGNMDGHNPPPQPRYLDAIHLMRTPGYLDAIHPMKTGGTWMPSIL